MPQQPSAISLMLCDQVVFEQGTKKAYLLGVFTGVAADRFPTGPQRFDIFAALTDGTGDVTMRLSVVHLDSDEEVYSQAILVSFSGPLEVVNLRFRVRRLIFETPGIYRFALMVDDQEIAGRRIHVYLAGE